MQKRFVRTIGRASLDALRLDVWADHCNGGYHSFGPGGHFDSALDDVLPIEMSRRERELDPTQSTRTDLHLDGDVVMVPGEESPIMHIAPESENESAWRSLKPLKGANKLTPSRTTGSYWPKRRLAPRC